MELPEGVLAYYLLKCANLTEEQQNVCRATCDKLTFKEMREKIERVTTNVKKTHYYESQFYSEQYPEHQFQYDNVYQQEVSVEEETDEDPANIQENEEQTYYMPTRTKSYRHANPTLRMNAPDEYGNPTRWGFCKSILHYISACPDAKMKKNNSGVGNLQRGGYKSRFPRSNQRGGFTSRQQNGRYF